MLRSWKVVALAAVLLTLAANPSSARGDDPWLTVSNCELVTIEGHEYPRITFDVHGVTGYYLGGFVMRPTPNQAPDDTCHAIERIAPAGWVAFSYASGGMGFEAMVGSGVNPGETQKGFQVVLSENVCCYDAGLFSNFGFPSFLSATVCFHCPGTTPSVPRSWGALKAHYR